MVDPNAVGKCLEHKNPYINPKDGWLITAARRNRRNVDVYDIERGQEVYSVRPAEVVRIYDCENKDAEMKAGKKRRRKTRRRQTHKKRTRKYRH